MALLSVAAEPPGAAWLRHVWKGQECIYNTAGSDDTDLMRWPGTAQDQPKHLCASRPPPAHLSIPQNRPTSTVCVQRHVSLLADRAC